MTSRVWEYYNDGVMTDRTEGNTPKGGILFENTRTNKKKKLEDCDLIKCGPGEKVLCVQRQHPITLATSMIPPIIGALIIFIGVVFVSFLLPIPVSTGLLWTSIIPYVALTILSGLLVAETFNFMTWYYQFYIITNKALLHKHFFTIGGFYSDAVFLEEIHQQEIIRQPPNVIYDFLRIQDVYIYFHKLEREEPFVFKTPENAQRIEDLLQDLTIVHGTARGPI